MADLNFPIITKLAGVTHYQPAILKYYRYHPLRLFREPDNKVDANAIAVMANGRKIGYVPGYLAEDLAPLIDAGQIKKPKFVCKNVSSKHTTVGIKIKIERK